MNVMDFFRKTKGSISIFLCLILLPMVTYATMIIDASRLQSSKTALAGAGDLTMNAALSEYDQVLKDMYGLFAMVQSEEDFEPALQSYFEQTIEGGLAGTNTDESTVQAYAKAMTNWVMQMEEDGELNFDNLLAMEVNEVSVSNVSSSALANPAVMKRQIIDYMKYRGPVSLTSTLFSKLSFMKNSSAQTEVLQEKVEYATSLNSVQAACNTAWKKVDEYNELAKSFNNSRQNNAMENAIQKSYVACEYAVRASYYKKFSPYYVALQSRNENAMTQSSKKIVDVDAYMISDETLAKLSSTEMYQKLNAVDVALLSLIDYTEDGKDSHFEKFGGEVSLQYDETNPDSSEIIITGLLNKNLDVDDMKNLIEIFRNLENELEKENQSINYENAIQYMNDTFKCQTGYYGHEDFENYNSIFREYLQLKDEYKKLYEAYENKLKADLSNAGKTEEEINAELQNNVEYQNASKSYKYINLVYEKIISISNADSVKSIESDLASHLQNTLIYEKAMKYFFWKSRNEINGYYEQVKALNTKISEVSTALEGVITAMKDAETQKGEWSASIENVDDGATKTNMRSDFETSTDGIQTSDVEALKEVVKAYSTHYSEFQKTLECISFYAISILTGTLEYTDDMEVLWYAYLDNAGHTTRINAISDFDSKVADISLTAANYAATIFLTHARFNIAVGPLFEESGYLDGYVDNNTTPFDKEKFVFTLKSICETKKTELNDEQKAEQNTQISAINSTVTSGEDTKIGNNTTNSSGENSDGKDNASQGENTTSTIDIGTILTEIADYCDEEQIKVTNKPETLDNTDAKSINVSTSSDTEGYQKQGQSSSNALSKAKNLLSEIANIGKNVTEYAYMEEYFTEMFSCDLDRAIYDSDKEVMVTLSGTELNPSTAWYGKEIEYILWGNSDLNSNVTANYAMIYMIRFALNAIYAFTAADIQSMALQVATAVAGWTVIGVPIVQAVVTIAVALAESGVDIAKLKQGEDVVIYKDASTFVCSPTGLAKGIAEEAVEKTVEVVEDKVDEMIDGIAADASDSIASHLGEIELMVDEYVEKKLKSLTDNVKNMYITPLINQLTPIMSESDAGVDSISNLVNQAVDNAFETVKTNIENQNDSVLRTIELEVYDKIVTDYKDDLKSKFNEYFQSVKSETVTQSIEECLEKQVERWSAVIESRVKNYTDTLYDDIMAEIYKKQGEAVSELKGIIGNKMEGFADQLSGTITDSLEGLTTSVEGAVDTSSASAGFTLNYKEYCKIFMFLKICTNEEAMLQRCAALMEANVRSSGSDKFRIKNAYTLMYVEADVTMHTLFPWGVEADINDVTGENGYGFSFGNMSSNSVSIHYSGINGY